MPQDYDALKAENERRYGTDIGRIGKRLLEDRYDKRTHFIFELLQNAEDALRRRKDWAGDRSVRFRLDTNALLVSHFGQPFDADDVVGICGIDQSTKDVTAIGRFGIGFKSVYAFTGRPEVHSGDEAFAIESYVWPRSAEPIQRGPDETVFMLPFKPDDNTAHSEIADGLRQLGPRTLLFLRHVEELAWDAGEIKGLYVRSAPELLRDGVRRVTILGEEVGQPDVEEHWLLFQREVTHGDQPVGHVEVAFRLVPREDGVWSLRPVAAEPLVVFFPTVLPTYVGFLVQGPYRTTPSRDNIPLDDDWNRYLVTETGQLLIEALCWLRDEGLLDVDALQCLPLDREKLKGHLFGPVLDAVNQALKSEALLPCAAGGHVSANNARLSRTQDLRELLDREQLGALLGAKGPIAWLSGDITSDRTPALRQYLMKELEIVELTPEGLIPRMAASFLERQSDDWIAGLYSYLAAQPALLRQSRIRELSLVRLQDGSHVPPYLHGLVQAFLPGTAATAFPTVKRTLFSHEPVRPFLQSLGLTEPDPVDDVIRNVLPPYREKSVKLGTYAADIDRILTAFGTDSKVQREKLLSALRDTNFVVVVDAGSGKQFVAKPGQVYIATERLSLLLAGISGISLVDDSLDCLRGESVRELLEASGATRYLCPMPATMELSNERLAEIRRASGQEKMTRESTREDVTLRGLQSVIGLLPKLDILEKRKRARLLWEALGDLLERRGAAVFSTTYRWFYFQDFSAPIDAAFVRLLNETPWIPHSDGSLVVPSAVNFEALDWKPNPVLQAKILFKPPLVEALAREVGIDPEVLDLLKKLGITSLANLQARLEIETGTDSESPNSESDAHGASKESASTVVANREDAVQQEFDKEGEKGGRSASQQDGSSNKDGNGSGERQAEGGGRPGNGQGPRKNTTNGEREFISYVAVHHESDDEDPDGLDQSARMALEAKAIELVIEREPRLQRTPQGNKGFDLVENDAAGEPERWVEIKAMKGTLADRPVGLSPAQFEFARRAQDQYWLYVVEEAGLRQRSRIVKIQNPVGRAGHFTFDRGWAEIAETDLYGNQRVSENAIHSG
ncbi:DUF3883 domain-containing protein [Mesorhizobium sp. M7A.F.Ca.US.008.03.1.1]|uniref:DUF3883 domain-containing protein n=1 Tax=Mesorhizobium sp. M7A.F.Ca.US.008.03.1.1 TaxID=2496742 RepID=UPI000FCB6A7C|nr:DUF3883 domain-containing protein [Mesorhizobium sp. M7A.F.Ca.US.008.03.1.1]RUW61852.1 DUF3883 domain-containing protein [Mesorhizobium sp. M7A.F.Ca.US.008.03.1.1]